MNFPSPNDSITLDVTHDQILNCQFQEWYPLYKDVTFKSEIIPLPEHFLRWLKTDGVALPPNTPTSLFSSNSNDHSSDSDNESTDISPTIQSEIFDFTDLNIIVSEAFSNLKGVVFPKLNWSSPQDASWMNMGNLKCQQPGDVYLLLKSSDFVSHDLYFPFDACTSSNQDELPQINYTLVLRKYQNLRPERSFRCFIKNRNVVGISQRDCTAYFPQLTVEIGEISDAISDFFNSNGRKKKKTKTDNRTTEEEDKESKSLLHRYPDPNFVADVYIDQSFKVWIVDVNVWSQVTDSLLFAWNESPLTQSNETTNLPPPIVSGVPVLNAAADGVEVLPPRPMIVRIDGVEVTPSYPTEVRIVENETCLRPVPFSDYKAPLEMHQFSQSLSSGGSSMQAGNVGSAEGLSEFIAFMADCEKNNNK